MREIEALRNLGVEIATISIRRSDPKHLKASADQREFATTHALLPIRAAKLLGTHLTAFAERAGRRADASGSSSTSPRRFSSGITCGARA
jgi:hypothetical protein